MSDEEAQALQESCRSGGVQTPLVEVARAAHERGERHDDEDPPESEAEVQAWWKDTILQKKIERAWEELLNPGNEEVNPATAGRFSKTWRHTSSVIRSYSPRREVQAG